VLLAAVYHLLTKRNFKSVKIHLFISTINMLEKKDKKNLQKPNIMIL